MDVHDEYYAPPPFDRVYGTEPANGVSPWSNLKDVTGPQVGNAVAPSTRRKIDAYDCAVAYLDASLGALFDELRRQGLYDDTIVLIVSDHGEGFGEHVDFGHGKTLYREVIHIPMLLRYPKAVPAGGSVSAAVSLADVPATLSKLAGLRLAEPFPGRFLTDPIEEVPVLSELFQNRYRPLKLSVARGDLISILSPTAQAIYSVDGSSLFAVTDRDQQHDLAGTPAGQAELRRLAEEGARRWPGRSIPEAWLAPRSEASTPTAADGKDPDPR
jgi:arylsulfatase A-like enzyme